MVWGLFFLIFIIPFRFNGDRGWGRLVEGADIRAGSGWLALNLFPIPRQFGFFV